MHTVSPSRRSTPSTNDISHNKPLFFLLLIKFRSSSHASILPYLRHVRIKNYFRSLLFIEIDILNAKKKGEKYQMKRKSVAKAKIGKNENAILGMLLRIEIDMRYIALHEYIKFTLNFHSFFAFA